MINDPSQATPDDLPISWPVEISGEKDEILEIQHEPDTTYTADQADGDTRLKVIAAIKNGKGGWIRVPKTLKTADRLTSSGSSSGVPHPRGLTDGLQIAAGQFNPYERYKPDPNEHYIFNGRQYVEFHNNV